MTFLDEHQPRDPPRRPGGAYHLITNSPLGYAVQALDYISLFLPLGLLGRRPEALPPVLQKLDVSDIFEISRPAVSSAPYARCGAEARRDFFQQGYLVNLEHVDASGTRCHRQSIGCSHHQAFLVALNRTWGNHLMGSSGLIWQFFICCPNHMRSTRCFCCCSASLCRQRCNSGFCLGVVHIRMQAVPARASASARLMAASQQKGQAAWHLSDCILAVLCPRCFAIPRLSRPHFCSPLAAEPTSPDAPFSGRHSVYLGLPHAAVVEYRREARLLRLSRRIVRHQIAVLPGGWPTTYAMDQAMTMRRIQRAGT